MSSSSEHITDLGRTLSAAKLSAAISRENPKITETLGCALANALHSYPVDAVILWSDPHTAVLGHIIARELGTDLIYAYADEGILTLSTTPSSGAHVVVVDFEWDFQPGLVPLLTMLRRTAHISAIATVLRPPPLRSDDIADAALISLTDSRPAESLDE